jgi:DNA-binding transcriptional MerR regulator
VCGVTRRQLCYWTDQGIIDAVAPPAEDDDDGGDGLQRAYDSAALRKVLLLKQSLTRGWGVRRAAKEADAHLEDTQRREATLRACSPEERQPFLTQQAERLDEMAGCLRQLASSGKRERLLALAAQMETLGEVCEHMLSNGTAAHEDVESCLAVGKQLDRLAATLAEFEDAEA